MVSTKLPVDNSTIASGCVDKFGPASDLKEQRSVDPIAVMPKVCYLIFLLSLSYLFYLITFY